MPSMPIMAIGPAGIVMYWTAAVLGLALVAGFFGVYWIGMRQIQLLRQQQDFVSAVSHELKTPLTSIRMYSELLREGWTAEEKKGVYYDYIYEESERLSRLIANVEPLITMSDAPKAVFFDDEWDEKFAGTYGISKAAQRALIQSWAAETARHGPHVHLLRPNPMPTAVRARFYPGEDKTELAAPRDEAARLLAPLFGDT